MSGRKGHARYAPRRQQYSEVDEYPLTHVHMNGGGGGGSHTMSAGSGGVLGRDGSKETDGYGIEGFDGRSDHHLPVAVEDGSRILKTISIRQEAAPASRGDDDHDAKNDKFV